MALALAFAVVPLGCGLILPLRLDEPADATSDAPPDGDADVDTDSDVDPDCLAVVLRIESDLDDGEIDGQDAWHPQGEDEDFDGIGDGDTLCMGFWMAPFRPEPTWGYFRFAIPGGIPEGATQIEAHLRLHGTYEWDWDGSTDALRVWAEDSPDAPQVDGWQDQPRTTQGRSLTEASVRWPNEGGLTWALDGDNRSPDLSPLFHELVARYDGMAANAHVQLWIEGTTTGVNHEVGAEDFSFPEENEAQLELSWCE